MDDTLTASLTPQQWDFVGKLLTDTINQLAPQVRQATAIVQSLQAQLNARPPAPNGVPKPPAAVEVVDAPASAAPAS